MTYHKRESGYIKMEDRMVNCLLELNIAKLEFDEREIIPNGCKLLKSHDEDNAHIDLYEVYVPEENKCFFISYVFYKGSKESSVWIWFNWMLILGSGMQSSDFTITEKTKEYLCYKVNGKSDDFLYEVNGDEYNNIKRTLIFI